MKLTKAKINKINSGLIFYENMINNKEHVVILSKTTLLKMVLNTFKNLTGDERFNIEIILSNMDPDDLAAVISDVQKDNDNNCYILADFVTDHDFLFDSIEDFKYEAAIFLSDKMIKLYCDILNDKL